MGGGGGSELNATMQFDDAPIVSDGHVISAKLLKMHDCTTFSFVWLKTSYYVHPACSDLSRKMWSE